MAKNTKTVKRRKRKIPIIPIVIVIALVICGVFFATRGKSGMDGKTYVLKQEKLKVSDISSSLKKKRSAERKTAIEEGTIQVFDLLEDYVFYGDSRVMGYKTYNFLDEGRIFADSGNTFLNVDDWDSQLAKYNPSTVIISYGVNDLGLALDNQDGGYDGLAKQKMEHILEIVPNAKIYLCTIIPCTDAAKAKSPAWGNDGAYNKKLKKACDAVEACTLVDTASLGEKGNADIYQGDGIHYLSTFYPIWLSKILEYME